MNKADLLDAVQARLGNQTSRRAAAEALDAVLLSMAQGIARDGSVQLVGFGSFEVVGRAARTGRNPRTGEVMNIRASKTVRFTPSSALKSTL